MAALTCVYGGHELILNREQAMRVCYRNRKGEWGWRTIFTMPTPPVLQPNGAPWHEGKWTLDVYDMEKDAVRTFALDDLKVILPPGELWTRDREEMFPGRIPGFAE